MSIAESLCNAPIYASAVEVYGGPSRRPTRVLDFSRAAGQAFWALWQHDFKDVREFVACVYWGACMWAERDSRRLAKRHELHSWGFWDWKACGEYARHAIPR